MSKKSFEKIRYCLLCSERCQKSSGSTWGLLPGIFLGLLLIKDSADLFFKDDGFLDVCSLNLWLGRELEDKLKFRCCPELT